MLTRHKAWIAPKDYEAFKRLMPDDPDFPNTYDEWLKLANKEIAEIQAAGHFIERVEVYPNEFAAYCHASGIDGNSALLHAFSVAKARKKN
jgi:hypothetical protein